MSDLCRQCRTAFEERAHPRFLTSQRDKGRCAEAGLVIEPRRTEAIGPVVWIARLWCDCQWRAQLHYVDGRLLERMLPDPWVQQELRRRSVPVGRPRLALVAAPMPEPGEAL